MNRGDIVTVSVARDYGKPLAAVVVQSDWLKGNDSVLVSLVTSTVVDAPLFRLSIEPTETSGLKMLSQIMVDKIVAVPREKCGMVIGRIDEATSIALNHMLAVMVGVAD